MRVVSLFSGIGAYERALQNIEQDIEIVNYCEILKDKSKAYSLLHNVSEEKNLWDITKIDSKTVEDFDLLCYSPPCQSYSKSGKQLGLKDIRGTLFYNALELIKVKKPKYCVMENVGNLPKKFTVEFSDMCKALEGVGYNNYWEIINAKDFIPQNRERVYLVSIRKDIDQNKFSFPVGFNTENWWDFIDLSDMRELTDRQKRMVDYARGLNNNDKIHLEGLVQFENSVITLRQSGLRFQSNREYPTLTAHYGKGGGNFTIIARDGKILGGITPRNCIKLMGFNFEDSDLLTAHGFSKSSQYIMAGDSVCVPVLEQIFQNLLVDDNVILK